MPFISMLGIFNALSLKDKGSQKSGRNISYGAAGRQKLDIYAPREKRADGAPHPVVVFIYGGSWMDGTRRDYDFVGRALAGLGYLAVIPDYRILPEAEYPAFLHDCAAAMAWTTTHIAEFGGDADKLALMGHSAGAYNAVMVVLDPRYLEADDRARIKAVVGISGPYDFYPFDVAITLRTFGAVQVPKTSQPVNLVHDAVPPMFLATGSKDTLVFPRNTQRLAEKLREVGTEVTETHYANAGHALTLLGLGRLLRKRVSVLADVSAFLKQYL